MIASWKRMDDEKRGGFTKLATYIRTAPDQEAGKQMETGKKVAFISATNCASPDFSDAVEEICLTQELNQKTRSTKNFHIVASLKKGEANLDRETWKKIEQDLCDAIGLGTHQRVSANHINTACSHLHIAINKIDRDTHKNISPSYSKLKLRKASLEIEKKYNLEISDTSKDYDWHMGKHSLNENQRAELCKAFSKIMSDDKSSLKDLKKVLDDAGVHLALKGNGVVIKTNDSKYQVKASSISRNFTKRKIENKFGKDFLPGLPTARSMCPPQISETAATMKSQNIQSFQAYAIENLREAFSKIMSDDKSSLKDLKKVLDDAGVHLALKGNGVVIKTNDGKYQVKASSISRNFTKRKIENRFGTSGAFDFSVLAAGDTACGYRREPIDMNEAKSALWKEFKNQKKETRLKYQEINSESQTLYQYAQAHYKVERLKILQKNYHWYYKKQMLEKLSRERAQSMKQLKERTGAARARVRKQASQTPARWQDWLAKKASEGNTDALTALNGRKDNTAGNRLTGTNRADFNPFSKELKNIDGVKDRVVTKSGDVLFLLEKKNEAVIVSAGAVMVRGSDRKTLSSAVKIAQSKFDTRIGKKFDVQGSKAFQNGLKQQMQAEKSKTHDLPRQK